MTKNPKPIFWRGRALTAARAERCHGTARMMRAHLEDLAAPAACAIAPVADPSNADGPRVAAGRLADLDGRRIAATARQIQAVAASMAPTPRPAADVAAVARLAKVGGVRALAPGVLSHLRLLVPAAIFKHDPTPAVGRPWLPARGCYRRGAAAEVFVSERTAQNGQASRAPQG